MHKMNIIIRSSVWYSHIREYREYWERVISGSTDTTIISTVTLRDIGKKQYILCYISQPN